MNSQLPFELKSGKFWTSPELTAICSTFAITLRNTTDEIGQQIDDNLNIRQTPVESLFVLYIFTHKFNINVGKLLKNFLIKCFRLSRFVKKRTNSYYFVWRKAMKKISFQMYFIRNYRWLRSFLFLFCSHLKSLRLSVDSFMAKLLLYWRRFFCS